MILLFDLDFLGASRHTISMCLVWWVLVFILDVNTVLWLNAGSELYATENCHMNVDEKRCSPHHIYHDYLLVDKHSLQAPSRWICLRDIIFLEWIFLECSRVSKAAVSSSSLSQVLSNTDTWPLIIFSTVMKSACAIVESSRNEAALGLVPNTRQRITVGLDQQTRPII